MVSKLLADAEALGYALRIEPEIEETTDDVYRAARVTLHYYHVEARELGNDGNVRAWRELPSGVDVIWQLSEWKRDRDHARAEREATRKAYAQKQAMTDAAQKAALEANRGKSEWEAICDREGNQP